MTTAGRLNTLILTLVVLAGLVLTLLAAAQGYRAGLDREVAAASARVAARADFQWLVYRRDGAGLNRSLRALAAAPTVSGAIAYTRIGEELAREGDGAAPPFAALRAGASTTARVLRGANSGGQLAGSGFFTVIRGGAQHALLSLPLVTTVNPENKLTAFDFLEALTRASPPSSDFVIGYVHLAIDLPLLAREALAGAVKLLATWLVPVVLGLAAVLWWNRRLLSRMQQVARTMDNIAGGDFEQHADFRGGREFDDIADALERLSHSLQRHQREIELGRDLLSKKVEERTSQLSRSTEELSRATEAASESEHRLQRLTYYDSLTSLPNRRLFTEQFGLLMRLSRRGGQLLALLYVGLDDFRRVNDSLGHHAGDLLLREVAKRLRHSVRDSDAITQMGDAKHNIAVSRMDGDEFTVVLNQLETPEAAAMVARRIIRRLSETLEIDGHGVTVSPRVGIAVYPGDGDNPGALLNAAATAMAAARQGGGDGFRYFHRDMVAAGNERLRIESDLRHALENRELELHFQPQIDTVMGTVIAIEALLRWEHPRLGMVTPYDFVAIAEEAGLMGRIGDWVLAEACQRLKGLETAVATLPRVAVNISAAQLGEGFAATVKSTLSRTGLAADRLELSLAEQALTAADESVLNGLHELRSLGVYLSLDGYGLGQSSLVQLSHFPLDELKIEREFVTDFREQGQAGPVLALIATARSLGLRASAEGVESRKEYRFLAEQGVKQMQGYLFSKPVPLETLLPMLAPWHFSEQIRKFGAQAGPG
ncbi:putative bifunctional diguanylate cyclase/phosphodiesterase [Parahaliea mediterranea]|uniref:EAL domain-containing protein n=1 Tax=Parahaliea mediterranea TaxID=651086 RepID=A0A939DEZ5_9GAMM|nr:EAL domain-containing protein [Parahaliea mediterranea]MBN7796839.1 EAL domain-containing protein [Parahaliea mediterranea]